MDYERTFAEALGRLKAEGRYRVFADLERICGGFPRARWHGADGPRDVTVWCSNDYLGMGQHPVVLAAMEEALQRCGAGAGGTRNISGTNHYHVLLERELADLHGKGAALIFTSGYNANEASLSTIGKLLPGCVIFSDALNHASMIEGIRHSGCEKRIFAPQRPRRTSSRLLRGIEPGRPKLIAFESVYSMDGDIAPIGAICDLADRYGAMTYLDEVHAVGMYGAARRRRRRARRRHAPPRRHPGHARQGLRRGRRLCRGQPRRWSMRSAASRPASSSPRAMPPVIAAGALASVRYLKSSAAERERHQERAARLKRLLAAAGLPVMPSASHIVPVFVGDAGPVQAGLGRAARAPPHLRPADQLPDRAARRGAPAPDADAAARRRDDGRPGRGTRRRLGQPAAAARRLGIRAVRNRARAPL